MWSLEQNEIQGRMKQIKIHIKIIRKRIEEKVNSLAQQPHVDER